MAVYMVAHNVNFNTEYKIEQVWIAVNLLLFTVNGLIVCVVLNFCVAWDA